MTIPHSVLALACLAILSPVHAQNQPPRPTQPERTTPQEPATGDVAADTDRILASWVMVANNNEVALAQMAQQGAQDREVKDFAAMLVQDHGEFGRKLQRWSSVRPETGAGITDPTGRTGGGRRDADDTGRTGSDTTGTGGTGTTGNPGDPTSAAGRPRDASGTRTTTDRIDHIALLQELGRKHLASAQKALREKQGADYDRCFVQMQVMAHVGLLDKLEVFANHASPELKKELQGCQDKVKSHLEKAKQLAKRLENGSSVERK